MDKIKPMEKAYLGDSVYAEFYGCGIVLTTENGLPGDPSNVIYLEPEVYEALCRFWATAHGKEDSDV